jgi:hypothetical protein
MLLFLVFHEYDRYDVWNVIQCSALTVSSPWSRVSSIRTYSFPVIFCFMRGVHEVHKMNPSYVHPSACFLSETIERISIKFDTGPIH